SVTGPRSPGTAGVPSRVVPSEVPTMRFLVFALGVLGSIPAFAADTYDVDPVHSTVLFSAQHFNAGLFFGQFDNTTGSIVVDDANLANAKINVSVDASSVSTWNQKRDDHLKGPDFFNATQFPKITFVSKSVTKSGDKYSVTGDFTLHGVTKPITVEFTKTG